ncbi:hypothetical protein ALO_01020 [Acetonema longum DSM 6540]|uniref:Uncharacterized protein n=1 Tax=Acetonema longum DSM 6540 TaxID=1009370 RepID=F7NDU7_9FIRM|nr:hypothetical protein ALO_01020 [Acetonema longum DSM 6540]
MDEATKRAVDEFALVLTELNLKYTKFIREHIQLRFIV